MKNFFDYNDEKITEKAFSQSLMISVLSIFLCLIALCSITYAWFTTNVSSGSNVIKSSFFDLDIKIVDTNNTINVIDNKDGTYSYTFQNEGKYQVILKMTEDATASKGYCEITINSTEKKQTESIGKDETFIFYIEVTANTVVVFEPKWGISSSVDIVNTNRYI